MPVYEDEPAIPGTSGSPLRYAGAACALGPFALTLTTTDDGVYRNWTAIAGGGLALVLGIVLLVQAFRPSTSRVAAFNWAIGVLALALYQLVVRSGLVL